MKIDTAVQIFLHDKTVYCAPKTCEYYKNMLHLFIMYLDTVNISDVEQIDQQTLKDFVLYLRQNGVKSTSIHTYMRGVKNFCSWGIFSGNIPPFDYRIKLPRPDPAQVLPLSTDEVNNILKYIRESCPDPFNKELLFRLMLDCGLRSSEALNLSGKDIDQNKGIIMINHSKFDKSRMIPLPDPVRLLLPDTSGPFFSFSDAGKSCFFARIKKRTGINRLHAHLLRHTFATSYMCKVGNLEFLRMYLGHASYDVTRNYIQSAYQC